MCFIKVDRWPSAGFQLDRGLMSDKFVANWRAFFKRPENRTRKAPEKSFGCFSKHPKNFEPEKIVIFLRKLYGYSLLPKKRFRVCFSCSTDTRETSILVVLRFE